LAQNDVVYVEPNKSKINGSAVGTNTGNYFFNFIDYFDYTDYYFIKINYSMENNRLDRDYENEFPLKSFLEKYLIHWHWFLTCACVSLI
jgi:hypothetical protein